MGQVRRNEKVVFDLSSHTDIWDVKVILIFVTHRSLNHGFGFGQDIPTAANLAGHFFFENIVASH